ncbi:hypothetical protein KIW84_036077 [Lathyrus oleraceus]|uniref:Uncharacterized protein n=1 Tax=Pisum sativum TaxID=3888 RepID=A0A9D4Y3C9_PEA|nr:hypothetical protein KIW84_036077 [Pisum sativum]
MLKPHVESHDDSRIEPNVETSGEPQVEPHTQPAGDIPVLTIVWMRFRIRMSVTKPQEKVVAKEVVDMDEETENDEEPVVKLIKSIARSMVARVKEKKKEVPTKKTSMKNIEIVKKKNPQRTPVIKKRKVEEKIVEKRSLKRNIVQSSQTTGGNSYLVSKAARKDVLLDPMEVPKALQETIIVSTTRKRNMDGLIKMLTKEKEVEDEEKDNSEEEEEE